MAELKETRKYHMRIVLRSGERWYLNLLVRGGTRTDCQRFGRDPVCEC
jgi:hypothetical protein